MKILIAVLMLGLAFQAKASDTGTLDAENYYKSLKVYAQVLIDVDSANRQAYLKENGPEIDNLKEIWGPDRHAILKLIGLEIKQSGNIRCEKRTYWVGFELNNFSFGFNLNEERIATSYECANIGLQLMTTK